MCWAFVLFDGKKVVTNLTFLKERLVVMPNGRKRKRKKIATHKRKKRLRKNRHKKK